MDKSSFNYFYIVILLIILLGCSTEKSLYSGIYKMEPDLYWKGHTQFHLKLNIDNSYKFILFDDTRVISSKGYWKANSDTIKFIPNDLSGQCEKDLVDRFMQERKLYYSNGDLLIVSNIREGDYFKKVESSIFFEGD